MILLRFCFLTALWSKREKQSPSVASRSCWGLKDLWGSAGCFQHHTPNNIPQRGKPWDVLCSFAVKGKIQCKEKHQRQPLVTFFPLKEGELLQVLLQESLSVCAWLSLRVCPSPGHFREELSTDFSYTHLFFTEIVFKDSHNLLGKCLMEQKHFSPLSSLACFSSYTFPSFLN